MRTILSITCLAFLTVLSGCTASRIDEATSALLEGATVIRSQASFWSSDEILVRTKAGCEWRIFTQRKAANLFVEPLHEDCAR
jgi:hypothetical protein